MLMVTEESTQQHKYKLLMITEESTQQQNIHVNGHRRKQPATEIYMLMVTEESTQQQKHTS